MRRQFNDSGRVLARVFTHPFALYDEPSGGDKKEEKPADKKDEKPADKKEEKKSTLLGDDKAPTDDKKVEEKPADKKVPDKYNLKLPDKSTLQPNILEAVSATARELGLPDDASAQKVVDFAEKILKSHLDAMGEAVAPGGTEWTKNVDGWEADALADKEIGGSPEALSASAKRAQRVLKTFFGPAVSQMLHNTGFGSHPEVLRAFNKIAKVLGEDKLVVIDAPPEKKSKSLEDKFYSESTSKKVTT